MYKLTNNDSYSTVSVYNHKRELQAEIIFDGKQHITTAMEFIRLNMVHMGQIGE